MISVWNPSNPILDFLFGSMSDNPAFKPAYHYVYIRRQWKLTQEQEDNDTDAGVAEWRYCPYLVCTRFTEVVGPEIDEADFYFDFGRIKREDRTTLLDETPLNLYNYYVQVRVLQPGAKEPVVRFTGFIPDDSRTLFRPDIETGQQRLKAYGIGYILNRWFFREGHIGEQNAFEVDGVNAAENRKHRLIGYLPDFNDKGLYGKALFGNRSTFTAEDVGDEYGQEYDPAETDPQLLKAYLFSPDESEEWDAKKAVEYLLGFRPNADIIKIELAGKVAGQKIGRSDVLEKIKRIWKTDGKSLWQLLNEIISRQYGVGFYVRYCPADPDNPEENPERFSLEVFSLCDKPIACGGITLPANPNQVKFTLPTGFPYTHLVDPLTFRMVSINRYDSVEARSANIRIMASFRSNRTTYRSKEGDLVRHWTTDLQDDYAVGVNTGPQDPDIQDAYRAQDQFKTVYRYFKVKTNWDGRAKYIAGVTSGDPECLIPYPQPDGTVKWDPDAGYFSRYGKEFMRDTFMKIGVDYTTYPPTDSNPVNANVGYVPMMAFYYDHDESQFISGLRTDHDPTGKWYRMEKLKEAFPDDASSASLRPLDREMGVEIYFGDKPNHYFGLTKFNLPGDDEDTNVDPEFNYENMVITACYETDAKMFVQMKLNNTDGTKDELTNPLVIECRDCEYWYASRYAVIDIQPDGRDLKQVAYAGLEVRNDRTKLQATAAFAAAWYGVDRQAVKIPIKQVGSFVELGTMLTGIDVVRGMVPVRTVVTAKECILTQPQMTTIETGYVALDAGTVLDAFVPTKSFSGRGGAATKGRGGKFN